ncbi:DUF2806 domain-containing protein [Actinobacillus equuli]|uniref:DUF2806 domain-containing protein n=1 Tax=Actinobacillus equuli TaxID=718 RepID=UPI00244322A5|nr:DUF2806 domain-containing protein [Actinobacillus equuli]WGE66142.1 DUF2806 domain-containing protein [Actinobacillus equuli subsp. equuli]WGE80073.1 DUF2806 domain-containing protein [Actinobacillus equuli subsp. equuli]
MGDFNLSPVSVKCDLTPLVQSIPNGVSKIFDLAFGKMVAKREAAKKLIDAQTERQSRLIIDGKAYLDENSNFIDFEKTKSDNIQQCLEYAVTEALNKDIEPSDEDVSRTFFNKWRDYAQHIEENELKEFWGRILTEEVYSPNSINLRVLNTLSMISLKEANFFVSTLKYIILDRYLALDFIPDNLKDNILDTLYNMGAIAHIPQAGIKSNLRIFEYNKDNYHYYYFYHQQDNYCFAFHIDPKEVQQHLSFELIQLTSVGEALYRLAHSVDERLSIDLFNELCNKELQLKSITSLSLYSLNNGTITKEILSKTL